MRKFDSEFLSFSAFNWCHRYTVLNDIKGAGPSAPLPSPYPTSVAVLRWDQGHIPKSCPGPQFFSIMGVL